MSQTDFLQVTPLEFTTITEPDTVRNPLVRIAGLVRGIYVMPEGADLFYGKIADFLKFFSKKDNVSKYFVLVNLWFCFFNVTSRLVVTEFVKQSDEFDNNYTLHTYL